MTRPTDGLEELSRPVVAFLLGDCKLPPHEALTGCLRELADEGLVRYETDAAGMPVISLGAHLPRSGRPLLTFEQVALARVRARAERLPRVPFSALVSDEGDDYKNWVKEQEEELGQEARRAGMAVKSSPRGRWQTVLSLALGAVVAVVAVHTVDWKTGDAIAGPVLTAALIALFVPAFLRRWRLTPDGAAAVAAWRRAGRGVPGAAAGRSGWGLGSDTGRTVWQLDGPQAAPLPKGHAWSSFGGQWHTVKLGDVVSRPYWSTTTGLGFVLMLTLMGSFPAVMIGVFGLGLNAQGKLLAITPAALGALTIVVFWLPSFSHRMTLPDAVTFPGEVIRLQFVDGGSDSPDDYLVWVDDGSPVSLKFDVAQIVYRRLSVGDPVQVSWSPRRRSLNDITPAGR